MADDDLYDVAAAITKLRESAEAMRDDALQKLDETPLARKLRTGTQEPSESWVADEWAHWRKAGRSKKEFAEAFSPEHEEPVELLPVTKRLLSGGVE